MQQDWKKISIIQVLTIVALSCLVLGVILATFAPMFAMFKDNPENLSLPSLPTKDNISYLVIVYLSITLLSIFIILTFCSSVIILFTNWHHEELKNKKVKWGLLSIFILGPIGNLVFNRLAIKVIWSKNSHQ